MTIIVGRIDGAWQRLSGVQTLSRTVDTCLVSYADGRQEEQNCEPYEVSEHLDIGKVARLVADGIWSDDELAAYGLAVATPFVAPEGKHTVGAPSYVETDGSVSEVYEIEDIPPPPPPPTPAEKLAAAGLTVEELRALLADD